MLKQQHVQLPGSLTPPQSDDAATGSPNSIPTLSPCEKEASDREEKKNSKRKKKKTEHNPQSHQTAYNQNSKFVDFTANLGITTLLCYQVNIVIIFLWAPSL